MIAILRHRKCSSAKTASRIGTVTSAVRDTITNAMLTRKLSAMATQQQRRQDFFRAQQADDRIGQRHRTQCEFLALIDVILDRHAVLGVRFQRELRMQRHDPREHHQQAAGNQERREYPHAARRTLVVIKQQRQRQQFRGRADRVKARAPCRIRPQRSDQRQRKQRDRQDADRALQRDEEGAGIERRQYRDHPDHHEDADQRRRPGQRERDQNRANIRRPRPFRGVAPGRQRRAIRRKRGARAHVRPPRARATSEVVLKPCRISTSRTSPPWASTISWPTTCSRV